METILTEGRTAMGRLVAARAAVDLRRTIADRGSANLVVATGASQFEVLAELVQQSDVDWSRVTGFHLDEYVGLSSDHPASFCRYLKERFVDRVPLKEFHYLRGDADPQQTIRRVGDLLHSAPVDLALVGIGENAHLAFNDPPADFETEQPYLIVKLDRACRQQQVGEGWFESLDDVPGEAMTMSIRQIMKSARIYCSVPDKQKAEAVQATLEGPVTPDVPASILREHADATLVIDEASAARLSESTRAQLERV